MYSERTYRNQVNASGLAPYRVVVKETDLMVYTETELIDETRELVLEQRGYVEAYIKLYPDFSRSLIPWQLDGPAPGIILDMVKAGHSRTGGTRTAGVDRSGYYRKRRRCIYKIKFTRDGGIVCRKFPAEFTSGNPIEKQRESECRLHIFGHDRAFSEPWESRCRMCGCRILFDCRCRRHRNRQFN